MLSYYTLNKLQDPNSGADEIIDYYENAGILTGGTDAISSLIDNVYINAEVIYTEEVKNETELLNYINNNYNENYKSIEEAAEHICIDIIDGYTVYAVIQ